VQNKGEEKKKGKSLIVTNYWHVPLGRKAASIFEIVREEEKRGERTKRGEGEWESSADPNTNLRTRKKRGGRGACRWGRGGGGEKKWGSAAKKGKKEASSVSLMIEGGGEK